jgi:hypothetical protein
MLPRSSLNSGRSAIGRTWSACKCRSPASLARRNSSSTTSTGGASTPARRQSRGPRQAPTRRSGTAPRRAGSTGSGVARGRRRNPARSCYHAGRHGIAASHACALDNASCLAWQGRRTSVRCKHAVEASASEAPLFARAARTCLPPPEDSCISGLRVLPDQLAPVAPTLARVASVVSALASGLAGAGHRPTRATEGAAL